MGPRHWFGPFVVLFVPFIEQRFDFVEQTLRPDCFDVGLLKIDAHMIQTFQVVFFVLFPPNFIKSCQNKNRGYSLYLNIG